MFTDRSRILEYQRCPRARWFGYHFGGLGIRRRAMSIPLSTGSAVHVGLAALLRGEPVDRAVDSALSTYQVEVDRRGLDSDVGGRGVEEQKALVEALIRIYHIRQLPRLLDEYEVLEVELEEQPRELAPGVELGGRADGLLQSRLSGDLYLLSFKTASRWDERLLASGSHDMQGLSEAWLVERRLGQRVMGIKMEWLIKGERKRQGGEWVQDSYLIRPWRRMDLETKWAWRYWWECRSPHETVNKNGRRTVCGGGRTHGLGDSFQRVEIWQSLGVKRWIEMLASGQVQPELGDPLEPLIICPVPFFRSGVDLERWERQTRAQEQRIAQSLTQKLDEEWLDRHFPMHRQSCDWPSRCEYQDICYGPPEALMDPMSLDIYIPREPHHPPEILGDSDLVD